MQPYHIVAQNLAVELLQALVGRGEVDLITLQSLESAIIQKLYFCVHTGRLDLQNKLLHLLHTVIVASIAGADDRATAQLDSASLQETPTSPSKQSHAVHPLLVQTLVDGISTPANRSILQHWLDFVLTTVPHFKEALKAVVTPLTDCVCRQLQLALTEILEASSDGSRDADDIVSYTTDADFMMLLTALERLSLLSMTRTVGEQPPEEDQQLLDKVPQESSGLLGYVSNVFGSDGPSSATEDATLVRPLHKHAVQPLTVSSCRQSHPITGVFTTPCGSSMPCGIGLSLLRLVTGLRERSHWPSFTPAHGTEVDAFWSIYSAPTLPRFWKL